MTIVFAINQFISHGFGIFLFASLAPFMREDIAFSNWHIAAIGASSQLAYLFGALLSSSFGERIGSARMALATAACMTLMFAAVAVLSSPLLILLALTVLAACAAMSWATIVEITSRCGPNEKCSTYLSIAASGTAWGCSFNGLLLLFILPYAGWVIGWQIAAIMAGSVVVVNFLLLKKLCLIGQRQAALQQEKAFQEAAEPSKEKSSLDAKALIKTVIYEPVARFNALVCFAVCFSTIPFVNWLNIYLAELQLPDELGGYTWSVIGLSGMISGVLIGRLADRFSPQFALMLISIVFFLGMLAFWSNPAGFALLAGVSYGVLYFPMWGIVSGWLSRVYSSTVTMQITSVCMVAAGIGGASGNFMVGWVRDYSGSLDGAYAVLMLNALLLALMALAAFVRRRGSQPR